MFDLFNQTDDDDAKVSESVNMDRFMLEKKLKFYFDDLEIYFKTGFFEKVCHREAWAIESGFAALPQELRTIAFHHAVLTNHAKTLKAFICAARNIKADINTDFDTFPERISPLTMACYHECRRSFLTLVEDGKADLSVCDDQGHSLAYACVHTENRGFMKWAQRHGVVFDVNDPVDALIPMAAEHNSFSVLRWLIEDLGGDVNITDEYDCSALNYALYKDKDIFLYLVDKGAKMTGKYEVLFGFIIDQIRELQKQQPSEMIDRKIDHQIETLRFLMNKA